MNDPQKFPVSIEELARLFSQHMPHGRDVGMVLDDLSADGKTRMRLPPQPLLSGDPGGSFFPGTLFSLADSACGLAVFRALGATCRSPRLTCASTTWPRPRWTAIWWPWPSATA